jgi:F-type H+-transporting ATP synthase subunit e
MISALGQRLHALSHCKRRSGSQRQVVRYSALVGGIGYGILHRRTLQAKADVKAAHAEYKHKEQLIQKAKEAYKNRLVAKQSSSGGTYNRMLLVPASCHRHAGLVRVGGMVQIRRSRGGRKWWGPDARIHAGSRRQTSKAEVERMSQTFRLGEIAAQ